MKIQKMNESDIQRHENKTTKTINVPTNSLKHTFGNAGVICLKLVNEAKRWTSWKIKGATTLSKNHQKCRKTGLLCILHFEYMFKNVWNQKKWTEFSFGLMGFEGENTTQQKHTK